MFTRNAAKALVLLPLVLLGMSSCGGADVAEDADLAQDSAESSEATAFTTSGGATPQAANEFYLGQPRADVQRFYGLYGDPANPGELRGQFFITEAKRPAMAEQAPLIPPGYLSIGAMWADVPPMSMKSLSETTFQQVDLSDFASPQPVVVEFEFGPDGNAIALRFTAGMDEFARRVRLGDLPASLQ